MDIKKKKLNLIKAIMDTHDIQVLDTIEAILGMKSTTPPISESMQDLHYSLKELFKPVKTVCRSYKWIP